MKRIALIAAALAFSGILEIGEARAACAPSADDAVLTCDTMLDAEAYLDVWASTAFFNAETLFKQAYDQWLIVKAGYDNFYNGKAIYNESFGPGSSGFLGQIGRADGDSGFYHGYVAPSDGYGNTPKVDSDFIVTDGSTRDGIVQALYKLTLTITGVVEAGGSVLVSYSYELGGSAGGYELADGSYNYVFGTRTGTGTFDLNNIQAVPGPLAGAGLVPLAALGLASLLRRRRPVAA